MLDLIQTQLLVYLVEKMFRNLYFGLLEIETCVWKEVEGGGGRWML